MRVLLVLCSVLAVKCAPNLQLGGLDIPLGAALGQNGPSYNVKMSSGGLEVQRHKERLTQRTDHREQRLNETRRDDKDPDHISESESELTRTHDSEEAVQETEDSGVKLGWTGVQLYNDTSSVEDRSCVDTESGGTRERTLDKSVNGTHLSSSGSRYNRSSSSKDHHETRQHTAVDLDGDFTKHIDTFAHANVGDMFKNIGKGGRGDVLTKTGRGKGGNATRETMTLDTHEGAKEETESSWRKTKDSVKDGNQTSVKTTDQASNHTAASKESSKNETYEKEIKIIKGDDEKVDRKVNNEGQSNDSHPGDAYGQEESNKLVNEGQLTSVGQEEREKQSIDGQDESKKTKKQ